MSVFNCSVNESKNSRGFIVCLLALLGYLQVAGYYNSQIFFLMNHFQLLISHEVLSLQFAIPNVLTLHLPTLNNICHSSYHLINLDKSSCSFTTSMLSVIRLNDLVSSANFNIQFLMP